MTENSPEQQGNNRKDLNWQNEADAQLNTSEWFGAIIRYFWNLGRKKFGTFYNQNELKKNAIIGWLFQLILIIVLLCIGYYYFIYS
ncbi:hypothetical protein [uncultured Dokdonia sp.]|uniref:hypothetical protein n=1 Tax=uncultured Dokdonia sp. TaxID=575653 RepID=UPI002625F84D|nr:hypothetical protein [uncultured Dokdonia sp.]